MKHTIYVHENIKRKPNILSYNINANVKDQRRKLHLSGQVFLLVGERIKGPFGTTNFPTRRIKLGSESPLTLWDVWLRLVRVRIRLHHIFAVRKVNLVGWSPKKSIITIKQCHPIMQESFVQGERKRERLRDLMVIADLNVWYLLWLYLI